MRPRQQALLSTVGALAIASMFLAGCQPTGPTTSTAPAQTGGAAPAQPQAPVELKFSADVPENHPKVQAAKQLCEALTKGTNNAVTCQIFHSGQLVKGLQEAQSITAGTIDFAALANTQMEGASPNLGVLQLPAWNGADPAKVFATLDGPLMNSINQDIETRLNVKLLGWGIAAPNDIYFREKQVRKPDDIKGQKIRSPGGTIWDLTIQGFGAASVAMNLAEVYAALQNKTIDGLIGTPQNTFESRQYEVMKHSTRLGLGGVVYAFAINKSAWARLNPDTQQLIIKAMPGIIGDERKSSLAANDTFRAQLEKSGMTIYMPTADEQKLWDATFLTWQDGAIANLKLDQTIVKQFQQALAR